MSLQLKKKERGCWKKRMQRGLVQRLSPLVFSASLAKNKGISVSKINIPATI